MKYKRFFHSLQNYYYLLIVHWFLKILRWGRVTLIYKYITKKFYKTVWNTILVSFVTQVCHNKTRFRDKSPELSYPYILLRSLLLRFSYQLLKNHLQTASFGVLLKISHLLVWKKQFNTFESFNIVSNSMVQIDAVAEQQHTLSSKKIL